MTEFHCPLVTQLNLRPTGRFAPAHLLIVSFPKYCHHLRYQFCNFLNLVDLLVDQLLCNLQLHRHRILIILKVFDLHPRLLEIVLVIFKLILPVY